MSIILLVIGFVALIKGADLLVDGASKIAEFFKIPSMIIGLTIVAFGTSAPELAVSVKSALAGSPDVAVGNIAGSSIFNLLLVVGITSLFMKIEIEKGALKKDFPFMMLITFAVVVLGGDRLFSGDITNTITRGDGLVLLCFFGVFMFYLVSDALKARNMAIEETAAAIELELEAEQEKDINMMKQVVFVLIGLAGVVLGGDWVVESSKSIALSLGMSEALVGLTIVAMGTSLPELVTSLVAAKKGESDMAIGNIIGSNIFNLLLVLGISATITDLNFNGELITDLFYLLAVSVISFFIMRWRKIVDKKEGLTLTFMYVIYAVFIIWRNYN